MYIYICIYIYIYMDTLAKQMHQEINCIPEADCLSVEIIYGYSFYCYAGYPCSRLRKLNEPDG